MISLLETISLLSSDLIKKKKKKRKERRIGK